MCSHVSQNLQPKADYLGMVGPILRAKVGDTIKVTLKNNARFTTSLHPHGVLYAKSSEGSPYNDGTSGTPSADSSPSEASSPRTPTTLLLATMEALPGVDNGSSSESRS